MEHIAKSAFMQQLQSMTSATEINDPNDQKSPEIDWSKDRAFTIYFVPPVTTDGDAPTIRFGQSMNYCFIDSKARQALERFIDAFAGNNVQFVDTTMPPAFSESVTPSSIDLNSLDASSREAAARLERTRDRTRSRLAATNYMRWHQLHGYSKSEAQHEKAEILKYLTENGVDPNLAEENLNLLEKFYATEE